MGVLVVGRWAGALFTSLMEGFFPQANNSPCDLILRLGAFSFRLKWHFVLRGVLSKHNLGF